MGKQKQTVSKAQPGKTVPPTGNLATKKVTSVPEVKGPRPDFTPRSMRTTYETHVENMYNQSSKRMNDFADGVRGRYGFKTEAGEHVIVDILWDTSKRPTVYIAESTAKTVTPDSRWYLLHESLRFETIRQVTSEDLFAWLESVHSFLRPFVQDMYKPDPKKENVVHTSHNPDVILPTHGISLYGRNRQHKESHTRHQQGNIHLQKTTVETLFPKTITITQAVHGATGFCNLSNKHSQLVVMFEKVDGKSSATVAHIDDKHVLRVAGVKKGDKVSGEAILHNGSQNTCNLSAKQESLARYIRTYLEESGVKFRGNQKRVAA